MIQSKPYNRGTACDLIIYSYLLFMSTRLLIARGKSRDQDSVLCGIIMAYDSHWLWFTCFQTLLTRQFHFRHVVRMNAQLSGAVLENRVFSWCLVELLGLVFWQCCQVSFDVSQNWAEFLKLVRFAQMGHSVLMSLFSVSPFAKKLLINLNPVITEGT